jgi:hypothetical protein
MSFRTLAILLSGTAAAVAALPAFAIEAEPAAQAIAAAIAGDANVKVTFDSATQDGPNVRIAGLTVADGDGEGTIRFDNVLVDAPTDGGGGIFQTPRIDFGQGTLAGKSKGSIGAATMTDVTVVDPKTVKTTGPAKGLLFKTAEATDMRITGADQPGELTVARAFVEIGNVVDNIPQDSRARSRTSRFLRSSLPRRSSSLRRSVTTGWCSTCPGTARATSRPRR